MFLRDHSSVIDLSINKNCYPSTQASLQIIYRLVHRFPLDYILDILNYLITFNGLVFDQMPVVGFCFVKLSLRLKLCIVFTMMMLVCRNTR